MKTTEKELPFRLNLGLDSYNPAITSDRMLLQNVVNLQARFNRLYSDTKHKPAQTLSESAGVEPFAITGFGSYIRANQPASEIYACTLRKLYRYEPVSPSGFFPLALPSQHSTNGLTFNSAEFTPPAWVAWGDCVYMTRPYTPIHKITQSTVTCPDTKFELAGNRLAARYMIESNRHLMCGGTFEESVYHPLRLRWSDLLEPEDFVYDGSNEADFFDIDSHSGFITGLSSQRGYTMIYTFNAIWRASYTPGRTIGGVLNPYTFEQLFSGLGNIYHHSMIQYKDVDFFIGNDNFYMIDGTQLQPVGDPIWNYFQETSLQPGFNESVYGHVDQVHNEIFWLYPSSLGDSGFWSVVYNPKENKWTARNPQNMYASYLPVVTPKTIMPIDMFTLAYGAIDDFNFKAQPNADPSETVDSNVQYVAINFDGLSTRGLYGYNNPANTKDAQVYAVSNEHSDYKDSPLKCEIETYEIDLGSHYGVKEITSMKLIYEQVGSVNVKLKVYTRNTQAETFRESEELELLSQLQSKTEFYFRARGVGQFIKFYIWWENTDDDYITEIYGMSLKVKVPVEENVQK